MWPFHSRGNPGLGGRSYNFPKVIQLLSGRTWIQMHGSLAAKSVVLRLWDFLMTGAAFQQVEMVDDPKSIYLIYGLF